MENGSLPAEALRRQDDRLNSVIKILLDEINPAKVVLFGSRGKNKASFNSDYDIAVDSKKSINFTEKRKLKEKIEAIMSLHKFDLVFLKEVDKDFRDIILKTGKVIYEE